MNAPTDSIRQIEGKHTLKPQGAQIQSPSDFPPAPSPPNPGRKGFIKAMSLITSLPSPLRTQLYLAAFGTPNGKGSQEKLALTLRVPTAGVTITQNWTTASLLDTKVELADVVAPGAKVDLQNLWNPSKPNSAAQKLNLAWKNPNAHLRAFVNYGAASGNVDATVDAVAGHEGFLVGGEAAYDVGKGAVTRYGLGLAYQTPAYNASVNAIQNLNVIMASYYQKVNSSVEVGAKAGYDVQASKAAGLELASKYKLDPLSFAKVRHLSFPLFSMPSGLVPLPFGSEVLTWMDTGQDQRPRYRRSRLQHEAQRRHDYRPRPVPRHAEAERGRAQDRYELDL